MRLSNWLYANTDATHRIALERLAVLVRQWLVTEGMDEEAAAELLRSDYAGQANTKLKTQAARKQAVTEEKKAAQQDALSSLTRRQARHMAS